MTEMGELDQSVPHVVGAEPAPRRAHDWASHAMPIAVVAAASAAWALLLVPRGWVTPAYLYLAVAGAALAVVDARTHRLPNAVVLPSYPIAAALLTVAAAADDRWTDLARAALGGLALFGAYFLLAVARPTGLGFGDVKLAGLLGGYLGWTSWSAVLAGILIANVLAAAVGLILIAGGRATRHTTISFGPYLIVGAGAAMSILAR